MKKRGAFIFEVFYCTKNFRSNFKRKYYHPQVFEVKILDGKASVCVCERESERRTRERERERESKKVCMWVWCVCVCVCMFISIKNPS